MIPSEPVALRLLLGQPFVDEADDGAALGGLEGDRHRRRARRQVVVILPAPGDHQAAAGLDLDDLAQRAVAGRDRQSVVAPGPQVDAGRDRLPPAEPVGLGQHGEGAVGVHRDEHRFLQGHRRTFLSASTRQGRGGHGRRQLVELAGPEHVERRPQFGQAGGHDAVVAEAPFLADLHQPGLGQHPQVLGDRGPGDREARGQLGDRLLSPEQELEQAPTVRLGQDGDEVTHRTIC